MSNRVFFCPKSKFFHSRMRLDSDNIRNLPVTGLWRAVLIVAVLVLNSGLGVQAQTATPRHSSRIARRLALADSLRLEMRKAADEGRLLQWGDSILRAKMNRGEIDSAKFERLHRRLQKVDRRLHHGDQLLQERYKRANFDTLYIARPDGRWTIKLRGNLSGAMLKFEGSDDGTPFNGKLKADYRGTMSVAVAYRGIAAGVAINPAKLAGRSKDNEFNLNSYSNAFGFDVVYLSSKTYRGHATSGNIISYIKKGQVKQQAVNLNGYYVFNHRRFSFPAAFSQSYVQRSSAGSVMVGLSFDGQQTDVANYLQTGSNARLRIVELGIGVGYGYNLVLGRHWLFHLSTLPTMDVLIKSKITAGGSRVDMGYHFPSVIITGRGAAVYSWRNKFVGLTMVYNTSPTGDRDKLYVNREKFRLRLFYGFRF